MSRSRQRLGQLLEETFDRYRIGHRGRLQHSRRLGNLLVRLYDEDPERAIREHVVPFVERERELLQRIYDSHSQVPLALCLDEYEGLALLERLSTDPERVYAEWHLDPEELENLANLAGVSVRRPWVLSQSVFQA